MLALSPIQINVRPSQLLSGAALLLGLAAAAPPAPAAAPPDGSARRTAITDAVQRVMPCVVNISTERLVQVADPFGQYFDEYFRSHGKVVRETIPLGSGVIVDPAGLVVTNYHVVQRASKVLVHPSSGRPRPATLVAADPVNDLALLRLAPAGDAPLDAVGFAKPDDLLLGETVVAVGSPFGLENSVAVGVLSARNRSFQAGDRTFNDILQTDAAINPGNSGGPLLNIEGVLIGINTAVDTRAEGIGFAIPINKARRVMHDLMSAGRVAPLWLGLDLQDVDGRTAMALGLRDAGGVLVTAVFPGSPAAKAGIVPGDIVESINASPVRDRRDYLDILRNQTAGSALRLQVLREGGSVKLEATPEPFSDADARAMLERRWGFSAAQTAQGVVVRQARADGPAEFLRQGDRITAVGSAEIRTMEDFLQAFRRERMSGQVLLQVVRNGKGYYARLIP